ncbi:GT2 family glycosyltransferase [Deinococcus metalli]|uniref:GT2 family glycosyltransferase n=1 Tax=Deinococcus metalli TaxID=1141878 RepID=A0A7W8NQB7_9DEIO|nr:glycosyltransferase [Deinococcus metalli]MBB5376640.1 GT2 family glycosyltransferase [Deinococcus metalli]GHF42583.1 hypothetical protein GCM10017781_18620 [Deinococcus metalli]
MTTTVPPVLSVVIGVRNGRQHITGCLDQIYDQGLRPEEFEVIVADGRSSDGTVAEIGAYVRERGITNLRVIDNERLTLAAAFNEAIPHLRGQFMAKVDAQSRIGPGYFRVLMDALARHPGAAVAGGRFEPSGDSTDSRSWARVFNDPWLVGPARYRYAQEEQFIDTVYLGVYRTAVIRQVGAFDERLLRSEDTDYNHRIRALGHTIVLVPQAAATYFVRRSYHDAFKQFHGYAYYRYAFIRKHGMPLTIRQKAPLAGFAALLALAVTAPWSWPALLGAVLGYCAVFLWRASLKRGGEGAPLLKVFLVYLVVHAAYLAGNVHYVVASLLRGRRVTSV